LYILVNAVSIGRGSGSNLDKEVLIKGCGKMCKSLEKKGVDDDDLLVA
jgi:hypothetical protein